MLQNMVLGPLSRTLGLVIIFAVFSLAAGSINGWYMLAEDAGVVNSERFDRIVVFDNNVGGSTAGANDNDTADEAWVALDKVEPHDSVKVSGLDEIPLGIYILDNDCSIGTADAHATSTTIVIPKSAAYTPFGTEVVIPEIVRTNGIVPIVVAACEFTEAGDIFSAGGLSGLIKLIMQAAGLGLPIGALIGLASFGSTFVTKLGLSPLMGAIVLVIGFLLVGTLLNVLTPFVDAAFNSLDGDRFKMYDEGLGTLASVIGNFFAVVLIGGLIYVAWNVIQQFKSTGSNSNSMFGDSSRGDQM